MVGRSRERTDRKNGRTRNVWMKRREEEEEQGKNTIRTTRNIRAIEASL